MTKIVVDDTLRSKLHDLSKPLEFIDTSGRLIGRFVPVEDYSDIVDLSQWEPVGPDITEEELEERERSTEWYTTDQVLEYLRNLEKP